MLVGSGWGRYVLFCLMNGGCFVLVGVVVMELVSSVNSLFSVRVV